MPHSSFLTTLLPSSSYLLPYALTLLFLSLLLTFAGAFLTLDRTRSFPPDYDTVPGTFKRRQFAWLLQGGVGGLAAGCAFGIHLSTCLALLIPAISTSSALTPKSFLPIWLLSAIVTALVSGTWRYVAFGFSGISGGTLLALSSCVIARPSLAMRVVVTAIAAVILPITTLIPLRFQHAALRFAMSVTGAFGIVLSIALLSHIQVWANVWERYWEEDSFTWGSSKEKGLSGVFYLFLCAGMVCDWSLSRVFGECPDEKWDHYLADYAGNLPNRAGTFRPLPSLTGRLFGARKTSPKEIVFTGDEVMKGSPTSLSQDVRIPFNLRKHLYITDPADAIAEFEFQNSPLCLKKGRTPFKARRGRRKEAVKFDNTYSSDSDLDPQNVSSWWKKPSLTSTGSQRTFNDSADDVGRGKERTRLPRIMKGFGEGEVPEYSDFEEDVTEESILDRDLPGFLRKHQLAPASSSRTAVSFPPATPVLAPLRALPATPSLMNAFDRIAVAQQAAWI